MPRRTIHEVSVEGSQRRKPSSYVVYSIKVVWSDGTTNMVYRRYSEVQQLERNLLEIFPSNKRRRFLPSLEDGAGRIKLVPTSVHAKVEKVRKFLVNLMTMPDHVSKCQLVIQFFTPRPEDLESVVSARNSVRKKRKARSTGTILRKISLGYSKKANCIGEPALLEQYVVLENYRKQYNNDINLTEGYTVDVIEKHESGWWHVDCEGDIGWVPASFISPVLGDNNNDSIVTEIFPAGKEEIYMTTHSYQAKKEDEISFDIGVNVQVIEKTLDGWWRVKYMNKEGWAPAVYLRRISVTIGPTQESLKRLPSMRMQLRDKTEDLDEVQEEVQEEEVQDPKGSSFLKPVWNLSRRRSASEADIVKTVDEESSLLTRRSSWGCVGDLRGALPNRGLSISEHDLRLAQRKEEDRLAADTLKRNRSFSISDNIKEMFGKKKIVKSMSLEDVQTSTEAPSSPLLKRRAFSDGVTLKQEGLKATPPSIYVTPPLSRKLGTVSEDVEALVENECQNMEGKEEAHKEIERKENGQMQRAEEKEVLTPIWNTHRRHSDSEVDVSLLKIVSQTNRFTSRRSSWSPDDMHFTRDLRDALPNRGMSISEHDLRLAQRQEEERMAAVAKRSRSNSFSENIKELFGKKNTTESVSSEDVQTSMIVSSLVLPTLKACSIDLKCAPSSSTASTFNTDISGNLLKPKHLRDSLPFICITPPVADSCPVQTTSPENIKHFGGNDSIFVHVNHLGQVTQTNEKKTEEEIKQQEEEGNACGKTNSVTKHQKQEETKQKPSQNERLPLDCNGEAVYVGQPEQIGNSKAERHQEDKMETQEEGHGEKVFTEEEHENSDSKSSIETDVDIYFAISTYVACGDSEMTVFEGEEVNVVRRASNGWWMVHIDGESGWVPSNFLMATEGPEEEIQQENVESDDAQENGGYISVENDRDENEHEWENDYDDDYDDDHGDDEDTDDGDGKGNFDTTSGVHGSKNYGQSLVRTQPVLAQRENVDGYKNSRVASFENRDITKRSPETSSKSSTDASSSSSERPPRYGISRRKDSEKKGFVYDKQSYKRVAGPTTNGRYRFRSGAYKQQEWCNRFQAMNTTRRSSHVRHSAHRSPLARQKNVVSYDSGFLEDERTNAFGRTRHSSSLPDSLGNYHNRPSHITSYRCYHSQLDGAYSARNRPRYRADRAPLRRFPVDDSSDEDHIPTTNRFIGEGSSDEDVAVHWHSLQARKKRNRPKLQKHSLQEYPANGVYHTEGQTTKLTHQAIAPYQASSDGFIDLYPGDKMYVIRKSRGGWWLVQIDDEVGWAPSNYLEPITCYDE